MTTMSPFDLFANASIVQASAPWCRRMENLELGLLLLTQPWITTEGLRRADLERRLTRLAQEMPLGSLYFQRVSRAAKGLESVGALVGAGTGRARSFRITPQGFVALVINLRVLFEDPTVDGSEFELKRSLVAMWNLLADRLSELPAGVLLEERCGTFFEEVEAVTVLGSPVMTDALLGQTMDVQRLIEDQRANVRRLRMETSEQLRDAEARARSLAGVDVAAWLGQGRGGEAPLAMDPATLETIQDLATRLMPRLAQQARLLRYDAYLDYLDRLAALYGEQLKLADLALFRRRIERGGRP